MGCPSSPSPDVVTDTGSLRDTEASAPDVGCVPPADAEVTCVVPCAPGNEFGVGRYCTKNGGQCRDNSPSIFCTQDYDDTPLGYCTRPCVDDLSCGTGAVCLHESAGSGCIPAACVAPEDGGTDDASADGQGVDAGDAG
jgi:hypothetical protein